MSLKTYRQKRNFSITSEPKGKTKKSLTKKLYIIQKHAASHLHYDFRLELNGVLLSWAVPKGPSLDPTVKRLAMHVEDHPVEYGSFEGIIPEGQYGGGTVMLWDSGEWLPLTENPTLAYKKGDLTFELKAKKLKGKWKLIRINKNDKTWLLMKLKDNYAKSEKEFSITEKKTKSVKSNKSMEQIAKNYERVWNSKEVTKTKKKIIQQKIKIDLKLPTKAFPQTIHPELATLVDKPPIGNQWLHEIKFDGYRLLAFKHGREVKLITRNQNNWTDKFQLIADELQRIPFDNVVFDGEVVVLNNKHHSDFQLLQNSIKQGHASFIYYIFDLLYFDKMSLLTLPLIKRKGILEKLFNYIDSANLLYSDHVFGDGKKVFKKSCQLGLEGIVSKNINSQYSETRDKEWLKTKCSKRQEFIIGGFLKSDKRGYFRSLMLGTFNKKGELQYHGNVGTGFTNLSLKEINQVMQKQLSDKNPFNVKPPRAKQAVWLKPVLVCEVEFTEWTKDNTLRHPSFKGLRKDKPAKLIKKEKELTLGKAAKSKKTTKKVGKKSKAKR